MDEYKVGDEVVVLEPGAGMFNSHQIGGKIVKKDSVLCVKLNEGFREDMFTDFKPVDRYENDRFSRIAHLIKREQ